MTTDAISRCGFAAIIGAPNAGKSTLINRLVGSKVSIVTQKIQTTRFPVRGIMIKELSQIILVDTPGIFKPKKRLERAMVQSAWNGAGDADAVMLLVDAAAQIRVDLEKQGDDQTITATPAERKSAQDLETIISEIQRQSRQVIIVLNKIDLLKRENLLSLTDRFLKTGICDRVFMISAEKGLGVTDLETHLASIMPLGVWHYPADQVADAPLRILAAEITREKLFLRVHEELPYACLVHTTSFKDLQDGAVRIEQTIFVEREGQRAIVIGKNGQTLKWIGQKARIELSQLLERQVQLFLHVKISENWSEDRSFYREYGLEYDS